MSVEFSCHQSNVSLASSCPPHACDRHSSRAAVVPSSPRDTTHTVCGNDSPGREQCWALLVLSAAGAWHGTSIQEVWGLHKACENRTFLPKAPHIFENVRTAPDSFPPFCDAKASGNPLKNACSSSHWGPPRKQGRSMQTGLSADGKAEVSPPTLRSAVI